MTEITNMIRAEITKLANYTNTIFFDPECNIQNLNNYERALLNQSIHSDHMDRLREDDRVARKLEEEQLLKSQNNLWQPQQLELKITYY